MAVAPRDIPITRAQVQSWVTEWSGMTPKLGTLEEFITAKVSTLALVDSQVSRPDGDEAAVVDLIIDDLPSYQHAKV